MRTFTVYRRNIPEHHNEEQANPPSEPQFEGVVFSDGSVAIRWLTMRKSTSIWENFDDMMAIHGHPEYETEVIWHKENLQEINYLHCSECGKQVSSSFPRDVVVRAWIECPECLEKRESKQ